MLVALLLRNTMKPGKRALSSLSVGQEISAWVHRRLESFQVTWRVGGGRHAEKLSLVPNSRYPCSLGAVVTTCML